MKYRILTREAQLEREDFDMSVARGMCCSCHICAPCTYCVHLGNPNNQDGDESCWEEFDFFASHVSVNDDGAYSMGGVLVPKPTTSPDECETKEEKPTEKKVDYSSITKSLCG